MSENPVPPCLLVDLFVLSGKFAMGRKELQTPSLGVLGPVAPRGRRISGRRVSRKIALVEIQISGKMGPKTYPVFHKNGGPRYLLVERVPLVRHPGVVDEHVSGGEK